MLAHGVLALCVAVIPAVAAQAATWTYTPELVRLDIDGNELPAGEVDVERDGVLRVGYGMILSNGGGQLMLFSEVGQPDAGPSHLRFGTQLARLRTNGSQPDLELYGERINPILDEDPTYGIMLNARGRF